MSTSPEIEPVVCPRCGDKSPLICEIAHQSYFVECDKCDCQTVAHDTRKEAIAEWHGRWPTDEQVENEETGWIRREFDKAVTKETRR